MPQRICSNDPNQFYSFTIWYSRGTVDLFPYSDSPMVKLTADLGYLKSIGRTPILVQEFSPDGYQFLAASDFSTYQATFGDPVWSALTGGQDPVGSISDDGFPTCYSIAGNAPGLCPPGYAWNPATEQCDPLPPPPPVVTTTIRPPFPPPGSGKIVTQPNPPPPPLGQPDPGGDEITDSLCRQIAADTAAIVHAINQLQGDGGAGDAACCAAVVNAVAGVEATLIRILTVLPGLAKTAPPVVNVTAPVTVEVPAQPPPTVNVNAPPPDLSGIVEQLKAMVREGDVKQTILDSLTTQGFLSGDDAQILSGADWGDAIVRIFRTYAWDGISWILKAAGIKWDGVKWVAENLSNSIATVVAFFVKDALILGAAPLYPEVRGIIDGVVSALQPTAPPTIGTSNVDADLLLAKTLAPIMIINGVMLVSSFLGWDVSEQLREYVDLAAEFVGLQEVRELKVGQMMKYGPMREAEIRAKSTFRQEVPGFGALAGWSARGLLNESRYRNLTGVVGLPVELIDPSIEAAKSGLNARMMLRLVGTGLFSDADVVDELTFAGMRQSSQHRLVLAAAYLGTEPERGKLRSALESAYRDGMVSDNEFVGRLQSAEHNTDRFNLLLETVQLEKQVVLAKEYEAAYSREFLAGLLDAPGYQSALEALGLQPPDVAARMFRDETHLSVTTAVQAARQARALQRAEASAERKTAIEAYRTGNSNEAALAAALSLTGLSPTQVAAMTSYQVLASAGVLRWIYGQKLPPSQATLLRQRVSDLTRQREIEMLTDAQYVSALTALGIPSNYINALRAGANAHVSPKTAAVLTPVVTT